MAAPRYSVKQADPLAVETDLLRLWGENLTIPGDLRRKFQWTYREPPVRPEAVFLLQADDQAAAIGTAGTGAASRSAARSAAPRCSATSPSTRGTAR